MFNKKDFIMMRNMKLEDDEVEIINIIRDIKRAYPNGYDELRRYLDYLIDETLP